MLEYQPGRYRNLFEAEALAQEIWAFLLTPRSLHTLEITARLRHPAVEGLDAEIEALFGQQLTALPQETFLRYKRMIGHMIRQIMEHQGYELDTQNIKTRSPNNQIFASGSRYKVRGPGPVSSGIKR